MRRTPSGPARIAVLREADEQTVFHDARNSRKPGRESLRVGDAPQLGVEQPVPAIRDENMAVLVLAQQRRSWTSRFGGGRLDRAAGRRGAERRDFNRQRKAAEHRDPFRLVGDHDHLRRCRCHDLLAQQRPAAALDQSQIGRDLVGAIDREVEFRGLVERGERNTEPPPPGRASPPTSGRRRRRDPSRTRSPSRSTKCCRGRTGAQPEPHAGAHQFDRARPLPPACRLRTFMHGLSSRLPTLDPRAFVRLAACAAASGYPGGHADHRFRS